MKYEVRVRFRTSYFVLRTFNGQLRADDRADAGGGGGFMKARRALHTVAIEQRDRLVSEFGRAIDDRFGQRRALQKTERGGRVQLDVRRGHGVFQPRRTRGTQRNAYRFSSASSASSAVACDHCSSADGP